MIPRILPLCLALGLGAFATPQSHAQEWPRFRGPNGSGLAEAPNLPAGFSEADFNWKIELPGTGHSSPVAWGERIFITSAAPGTAKRIVSAVNAKDGKILWNREYETATFRQHADNSYAASSPAVDAERVYVWWGASEGSALVALDQKTGREVWKQDLGSFSSQHGPGTSPVVVDGSVLLNFDQEQPESFLVCVDAATGKVRWKTPHAGTSSSASTPCIRTAGDGRKEAILISRTNGITAVDVGTGKVNWELPGVMQRRCVASPILTPGGLIVAQCGEGQAESFVVVVKPGQKPEKVYEVVRSGGYVPTPLAVGELLFLWKENGLVTCLRAATNEQLWSERVEGPFYGSPMCVNGRLYNITRRGDLVVIAAGEKFQKIARIPLGEGSFSTPAVSGGKMYLRTFSHLISVGK